MLFHHREMHRIAHGEMLVAKYNLFGALDNRPVHRKDFVDCIQKRVEGWLDVVAAIDGDIAMQDFLQHFGVGDQALALADNFSSSRCASVLWGPGVPTRYIGILESIRITDADRRNSHARFPPASYQYRRLATHAVQRREWP